MSLILRESIDAVEFFGLPGSGKTTIARELVSLLRDHGVEIRFSRDIMGDDLPLWRRTAQRMALVGKELSRRPSNMIQAMRYLTPRPSDIKDAAKTRWNFMSVVAMQSRYDENALLVADQGVAQGIWTARVHHGQDAAPLNVISKRQEQWIKRTLFIHVDVPLEIARERLARRARITSRFQHPNRIGDTQLWVRGHDEVRVIVDGINLELEARRIPREVFRVPNCGAALPLERALDIRDVVLAGLAMYMPNKR